ncbi:uncharacterized protein C22orf42-like [Rhinopithecus roxellana]|uniref:uncharacterized protein C22orf42-like n=1 Tax=Rhinopithecus roxellana TaxID=61622 RepID=UPI0012372E35|nr:uncharacterized protein C22orf42-like [Rhinopithecus roxellana]
MKKLHSPMGPCGGLICDCCRLNVGPCEESETPEAVAAAPPASTAAEPARFDLGATEVHPVHYHSNAKISKGLPIRPKGRTTKLWKWSRLCCADNKGSVEIKSLSSLKQLIAVYSFSAPY